MTDDNNVKRESNDECKGTQTPDSDEALLTKLFLHSPIGIYIVQGGTFVFVNPEMQKIVGYTEDELMNMHPSRLVLPEDWDRVRENSVKILKEETPPSPYTYRVLTRDGDTRWIIETVVSIVYRDKRATLGYFMDNTGQQLAKEALRKVEDRFEKAFRSIPDPVVISRVEDGIFLEVNEAFLKASGYSRNEVVGRTSLELGIWPDNDTRSEFIRRLAQEGFVRDMESRFRLKSGEIRFLRWSADLVDHGEEQCVIALGRDITDRKQAEFDLAPHKALFEA
ncbi:MAG: PAS domain-containing protein [Pseudomonadota bacterium]